jgi:hypothetical protein
MNRPKLMVHGSALALAALLAVACDRDLPVSDLRPMPDLAVGYELSSLDALPGDRVTVAIGAAPADGEALGGLQGYVRFDPTRLRLVGQNTSGRTLAITNYERAADGELRVASLNTAGLDRRAAVFTFEVRAPDYARSLSYRLEMAVTLSGREFTRAGAATVAAAADLVPEGEPRILTLADWDDHLWPDVARQRSLVPGQYRLNLVYGDATLDGNLLINDASYVANVSVGNQQLILGTDAPARDAVVAGNVRPANLPGLGEASDANPPGRDAAGTRTILINDALAIAQEAVGTAQDIVGDLIPGRGPVATNRIIVNTNITTNTTWSAVNIYEVQGLVRVTNGAVLTIEAGTRIEGNSTQTSALFIERDGQINAVGTPLQPIVFTCTAAIKAKGCWSGLWIAGNAPINTGTAASPIIPGRADTGGCLQAQGEGNAPVYGGCNADDNSGTLQYAVIEYGGFILSANNELNGLSMGGVGRNTSISYVQVHAGLDDAFEFFGGTNNVHHLVATANSDDSFDFSFGWSGNAQFVIVQQDSLDAEKGIEADNTETSATYDATPVTTPQLWNFTFVGEAAPTSTSGAAGNNVNDAIHLRRGTAPSLNNFLVLSFVAGLDLDDAATCTAPEPAVRSSLFAGIVNLGNADGSDPVCATAATEAVFLQLPAQANQVVASAAGILIAPFSVLTADFRPAATLPAGVSIAGATPPAAPAGFYDQSATYIGAVPQASAAGGNVPWYSGWTRGWQSATTP